MATFMFKANYSHEGLQGLVSEGAAVRSAAIEQLVTSLGGNLVSLYWALGETDAYVVVDGIDDESATAAALTVGSSGGLSSLATVKLLTSAEVDAAIAKSPAYRPPGR